MEQFIVSARKYRPNFFDSLVGQDNIVTTLKNSILRGQLAHAYLFCGPRGVGKTTTARIFAKTINCLHPSEDMEPCGQCESCRSFSEGRSYCIHELDAASNNSVDDIRTLTEMVRIPPQIGKYSVYIIDEVHMLSSAAFNAFLKTLEEPPSYAIFILATTEKHKILPTILSRCQTYDFNRISIPDIIRNLEGIAEKEGVSIEPDALHILAQKADGAMRDALTLFDQSVSFCGKDIKYEQIIRNLNVLDYEYYFRMVDAFLQGDYTTPLLIFDEVLSKGFNALYFISGLSSHLRDLIVCKNNASQTLLSTPPTLVPRYMEQSGRCTVGFLFNALSITTACESGYKQSGNPRLLIEFTLMKLAIGPQNAQQPAKATLQEIPAGKTVTPAPMPAPAPERKSEPAPEPAPKPPVPHPEAGPASPAVPSLKEMLRQAKAKVEKGEDIPVHEENKFSVEHIDKIWKELSIEEAEKRNPKFSSALLQLPIDFSPEDLVFKVVVNNEKQKTWIEHNRKTIISDFLKARIDPGLTFEIEIANSKDLYMPSQKATRMMEKSEGLRELKKNLELDIE